MQCTLTKFNDEKHKKNVDGIVKIDFKDEKRVKDENKKIQSRQIRIKITSQ